MEIARDQLTILLNALYDLDETTIPVKHPSEEVDELLRIELGPPESSTVRLTTQRESYKEARNEVRGHYGEDVASELPEPTSYLNGLLAGGVVSARNQAAIDEFPRACQVCEVDVRPEEPHIEAAVWIYTGKQLGEKLMRPVFCSRSCWAEWASAG